MWTGSTNETEAKKRRRARSGHSKRAIARPTAQADKDSTKKERGMEWVSDSEGASTEEHTRDRSRTPEREEPWREPRTLERLEAHPEGSRAKHQRQLASVIKCYVGGHGTVSSDREELWREPRTSEDSRPQRGPPGNAPAATGREEKPQTEAQSPSGRI